MKKMLRKKERVDRKKKLIYYINYGDDLSDTIVSKEGKAMLKQKNYYL